MATEHETFFVASDAMEPTLRSGDDVLVDNFVDMGPDPRDGDIIVFPPPIETKNDFIKRLMGSPGETFRIHHGTVYRNGVALVEPYIAEKPTYELEIKKYDVYVDGTPLDPSQANVPPKSQWTSPDTIPPNYYFMMNDNRNDSEDSHNWGFAQLSGTFATGVEAGHPAGLTGRASSIIAPPERKEIFLRM
jgi:signal peptidase I